MDSTSQSLGVPSASHVASYGTSDLAHVTPVAPMWASEFDQLLGPLEHLIDLWQNACRTSPGLEGETMSALAQTRTPSNVRQALLDALSPRKGAGSLPSPSLFGNPYAYSPGGTSWVPASPPESTYTSGYDAVPASQMPPVAYIPSLAGPSISSARIRSASQPMPNSYSRPLSGASYLPYPPRGTRQRISAESDTAPLTYVPPLDLPAPAPALFTSAAPSTFSRPQSVSSSASQSTSSTPVLHHTALTTGSSLAGAVQNGSGCLSSSSSTERNISECFVLHDRDLQARYPNDALEKSVQSIELIESSPGPVDQNGTPTSLLTFAPVDMFPKSRSIVYLAVLSGDVLTTLGADGRTRSPHLTIFRFGPGEFIDTPSVPIGASHWWRNQVCDGAHPSTGGAVWTARHDTANMRRRARILQHFSTCQLGDVPASLRAFATSLKNAGEDRRESVASSSD